MATSKPLVNLADLEASITEQQNQALLLQQDPLQRLFDAAKNPGVLALIAVAEEVLPELRDSRQQWAGNILAVVREQATHMEAELARMAELKKPAA